MKASRLLPLLVAALALALPSSAAAVEGPPGFFGINASSSNPGDFRGMADADAGVTRTVFPFQVIKQGRRKPYYWGYSDNLVKSAADNGLKLIPMLYGSPPWISEELNRTPLRGEAKRAWRDLCIAMVERYGPEGDFWAQNPYVAYEPIEAWQIWNEPNSITWWGPKPRPSEYALLLRRSADAIHSVDPAAEIVTAGIVARPTNPKAIRGTVFLEELFAEKGVTEAADALAYHPYAPSVAGVQKQLEGARRVLDSRRATETPIWITEIGWGTKGPRDHPLIKSRTGQDRVLRETMEMSLAQSPRLLIEHLLWYQWGDRRDDLCLWCETSGLVNREARPKGIFETFRKIATR